MTFGRNIQNTLEYSLYMLQFSGTIVSNCTSTILPTQNWNAVG